MNGEQRETARARYAQKLTPRKVRRIRERFAAGGVTEARIARDYGVTVMSISNVVRRRTWAWVDAPERAHGSRTETR